MKLIDTMDSALGFIDTIVKWIVGGALLLMTLVLFLNALGRTFFSASFIGGPALGRFLVIWLCFLGAYLLVRSGGHVAIDVVSRAVSDRAHRWLTVVIGIIGTVTMSYVGWHGYVFTAKRFAYGQMDPMLNVPTGFFYMPLPVGGFLMAVAFLFVALKAGLVGTERPPEHR
jgi:TRAP-type C4-dicarboxylate transport system permease small subunit